MQQLIFLFLAYNLRSSSFAFSCFRCNDCALLPKYEASVIAECYPNTTMCRVYQMQDAWKFARDCGECLGDPLCTDCKGELCNRPIRCSSCNSRDCRMKRDAQTLVQCHPKFVSCCRSWGYSVGGRGTENFFRGCGTCKYNNVDVALERNDCFHDLCNRQNYCYECHDCPKIYNNMKNLSSKMCRFGKCNIYELNGLVTRKCGTCRDAFEQLDFNERGSVTLQTFDCTDCWGDMCNRQKWAKLRCRHCSPPDCIKGAWTSTVPCSEQCVIYGSDTDKNRYQTCGNCTDRAALKTLSYEEKIEACYACSTDMCNDPDATREWGIPSVNHVAVMNRTGAEVDIRTERFYDILIGTIVIPDEVDGFSFFTTSDAADAKGVMSGVSPPYVLAIATFLYNL